MLDKVLDKMLDKVLYKELDKELYKELDKELYKTRLQDELTWPCPALHKRSRSCPSQQPPRQTGSTWADQTSPPPG